MRPSYYIPKKSACEKQDNEFNSMAVSKVAAPFLSFLKHEPSLCLTDHAGIHLYTVLARHLGHVDKCSFERYFSCWLSEPQPDLLLPLGLAKIISFSLIYIRCK